MPGRKVISDIMLTLSSSSDYAEIELGSFIVYHFWISGPVSVLKYTLLLLIWILSALYQFIMTVTTEMQNLLRKTRESNFFELEHGSFVVYHFWTTGIGSVLKFARTIFTWTLTGLYIQFIKPVRTVLSDSLLTLHDSELEYGSFIVYHLWATGVGSLLKSAWPTLQWTLSGLNKSIKPVRTVMSDSVLTLHDSELEYGSFIVYHFWISGVGSVLIFAWHISSWILNGLYLIVEPVRTLLSYLLLTLSDSEPGSFVVYHFWTSGVGAVLKGTWSISSWSVRTLYRQTIKPIRTLLPDISLTLDASNFFELEHGSIVVYYFWTSSVGSVLKLIWLVLFGTIKGLYRSTKPVRTVMSDSLMTFDDLELVGSLIVYHFWTSGVGSVLKFAWFILVWTLTVLYRSIKPVRTFMPDFFEIEIGSFVVYKFWSCGVGSVFKIPWHISSWILHVICRFKTPGTVDSASIIENKQNLRVFWERRIMAEQDRSIRPVKTVEEIDVTPPDSLNGDVNETVESPPQEVANTAVEKPAESNTVVPATTAENKTPEETVTTPENPTNPAPAVAETPVETASKVMDGVKESAVVGEVLVASQQQEQLKDEPVQKATEPAEPSVLTPAKEPQQTEVPKTETVVSAEASEVDVKAATASEETAPTTPVVDQATEEIVSAKSEETEIPAPPPPPPPPQEPEQPTPIIETVPEKVNGHVPEVVEEIVASKPQIIGETYHHVTKPQPSSPKAPAVTLKSTIPSPMERTFKAESLIAIEIQEMQKREEELKKMRERTSVDNTVKPPPSESNHSEGSGSVHSDDSLGQSPPPSLIKNNIQNVSRTISLDSVPNGQAYNIGYVFGRKENVKVKPLVDPQESDDDKPKTISLKETPIEREIRISREREEELRKEKGLQVENGHEESLVRPTSLGINKSRVPAIKQVGETQRILATSRIQQEIEEQTEREKSLRASGIIKTISQERTDSRVTGRLGELTNGDSGTVVDKTPLSPVSSNDDNKSASPVFNGTNGTSSPVNGKMNGSVKTPSPSNSTVSSSPLKANSAGRRFSNPPPGRGVNMQRFISSKGKDVAFKSFNGNGLEKSSSLVALNNELYELKPPQIPVQNKINQRRSVTMAGPRIQEELKEMQEREDELKKQRARMIGLSQPNLSVLVTEDDLVMNGHDEKPSPIERANSNPNLLENGDSQQNGHAIKDEKSAPVGNPRRRSTLIDQWEQRIQKSDIKS